MAIISEFSASLEVKKDDGNEDKQGTEEVGIIGYEIQVVIEYDCFQRCLVVDEVIDVFIDIKYDSDGDDQSNGKEISTQKLDDDVFVKSLQPFFLKQVCLHCSFSWFLTLVPEFTDGWTTVSP